MIADGEGFGIEGDRQPIVGIVVGGELGDLLGPVLELSAGRSSEVLSADGVGEERSAALIDTGIRSSSADQHWPQGAGASEKGESNSLSWFASSVDEEEGSKLLYGPYVEQGRDC